VSSILAIEDLVVSRGRKFSLAPLTIRFDDPGIVGLFGHNGAGKTTLLKALAGLLPIESGSFSIGGAAAPTLLPDAPFLYSFLKVGSVPGVLADYFDDFDPDRGRSIIDELSLDKSKKVGDLSKGMEEQLNLGMALARRSSVYLLDEPISGVDPAAREIVLDGVLRDFESDSLMLISTHLIADVEPIVDSVVFLKDGRLLLAGDADDLRQTHSTSLDALFRKEYR